ncbi:MAG: hypothetical protein PHX96_03790, partial [Candidatus Nanoarchaeia archaeon]|nr:hypothetical protein [Candidatus Nanoarchaeia archaeon]
MQIIGFSLNKISIERKEKQEGKLEIKQNINIDNISKDKINLSEGEIIKIDFTFNVDYNPALAKLEIKGQTVLLPNKEEIKDIPLDAVLAATLQRREPEL